MKRIINGKRYDTETATLVATHSNGCSYSDFHHVEERLYLTLRGAFFIHGGGGPLSKYAKSTGTNSTSGSQEIIPLDADEARSWLEEHDFADEVENLFPDQIQDA